MRWRNFLQNPLPLTRVIAIGSLVLLLAIRIGTVERQTPGVLERATSADAARSIPRGGAMTTADGAFARYRLAEGTVTLGSHTRLDLINNTDATTLRFLEGVVDANGLMTFTVRDLHVIVTGRAVLTHYSWRDEMDIIPLEGAVELQRGGTSVFLTPGSLWRFSTLIADISPEEFAIPADAERERLITW